MAEFINVYEIFVGKPEGKIPLGRAKCKLMNNRKNDSKSVQVCRLDSSCAGQAKVTGLENTVKNLWGFMTEEMIP
jgi:hypothetical protein